MQRIRWVERVRRAEGRIVMGVNLDLDGQREAMTAQVVSLPDSADGLHQLFVREGALPTGPGEAVIGEVFAEAKRADLHSYLTLRYPSEDIPKPARAV